MYVILVYDINTETEDGRKRIKSIMKKCREYLYHTQKSTFEGEITELNLMTLKFSIEKIINKEQDNVVLYILKNKNNLIRENLGIDYDPTNNII